MSNYWFIIRTTLKIHHRIRFRCFLKKIIMWFFSVQTHVSPIMTDPIFAKLGAGPTQVVGPPVESPALVPGCARCLLRTETKTTFESPVIIRVYIYIYTYNILLEKNMNFGRIVQCHPFKSNVCLVCFSPKKPSKTEGGCRLSSTEMPNVLVATYSVTSAIS